MAKYEVTLTIPVIVNKDDVQKVRKENRNFMSTGFFSKDENIGQSIAYNKALELVSKQNDSIKTEIKLIPDTLANLNIKRKA